MKKIFYIHGANSTSRSFNFIKDNLPNHIPILVNYETKDGLNTIIEQTKEKLLEHRNSEIDIISHSLGGIIAFAISKDLDFVKKIVTISTPFGGINAASTLKWVFPNVQLFKDICSTNPLLINLRKPSNSDVLSIVSTAGGVHNLFGENDGVVSISSQKFLSNINYVEFELNHFEVLLDEKIIQEIKKFIW